MDGQRESGGGCHAAALICMEILATRPSTILLSFDAVALEGDIEQLPASTNLDHPVESVQQGKNATAYKAADDSDSLKFQRDGVIVDPLR